MKEIVSTITSKGQVTIPAEIRKRLNLHQGDRLSFLVADDGTVTLAMPAYPTVASLRGRVATLDREINYDKMKAIAYEERFAASVSTDE